MGDVAEVIMMEGCCAFELVSVVSTRDEGPRTGSNAVIESESTTRVRAVVAAEETVRAERVDRSLVRDTSNNRKFL